MALVQTRASDVSGDPIPAGSGARVRVIFWDGRADRRADLTDEEVERLLPFVREVTTRPERRGERYERRKL